MEIYIHSDFSTPSAGAWKEGSGALGSGRQGKEIKMLPVLKSAGFLLISEMLVGEEPSRSASGAGRRTAGRAGLGGACSSLPERPTFPTLGWVASPDSLSCQVGTFMAGG